jgi:Protein of unknown function (DUF2442)
MVELTDAQIDAALERGRIAAETEPRAAAARYDAKSGRVIIDLTNGATFAFPSRLAEGLSDADPSDLADIEVLPRGFGLHWPKLDVDYSVPGLVSGIFGTARWMAARAGRGTSKAKAAAARANGAKGGRPRKAG